MMMSQGLMDAHRLLVCKLQATPQVGLKSQMRTQQLLLREYHLVTFPSLILATGAQKFDIFSKPPRQ